MKASLSLSFYDHSAIPTHFWQHIGELLMTQWGGRGAGIRRVDNALCEMIFRTTGGDPLFTSLLCRALRTRSSFGRFASNSTNHGTNPAWPAGITGTASSANASNFESVMYRSRTVNQQKRMSVEVSGFSNVATGVAEAAVGDAARRTSVAQNNQGKDANASPLVIDDEGVLRSRRWPALDLSGVNLLDLVQGIYERTAYNLKRAFSVACIFGQGFTVEDIVGGFEGAGTTADVLLALEEDVEGLIVQLEHIDPELVGITAASFLPPPPSQHHHARRGSQIPEEPRARRHSHTPEVQVHAPRERRGSHLSEKIGPQRERRGSHLSEKIAGSRRVLYVDSYSSSSQAMGGDSHSRIQLLSNALAQQQPKVYGFQSAVIGNIFYECQNFLTRQATHSRLAAYLQNRHEKSMSGGGVTVSTVPHESTPGGGAGTGEPSNATRRASVTPTASGGGLDLARSFTQRGRRKSQLPEMDTGAQRRKLTPSTSLTLSRIAYHQEKANNIVGLMTAVASLAKMFHETSLVDETRAALQKLIGLVGGGWGSLDDSQRAEWLVMLAEMHIEIGDRVKAEECLHAAFKLLKIYYPRTFLGRYMAQWSATARLKVSLAMALTAASSQAGTIALRRRSEGTMGNGTKRRRKVNQTPASLLASLLGNQEHMISAVPPSPTSSTELNRPGFAADQGGLSSGGGDGKSLGPGARPRPPPPCTSSRAFTCLQLASRANLHKTLAVWLACEGFSKAFRPSPGETAGTAPAAGSLAAGGGISATTTYRASPACHMVLRALFPVMNLVLVANEAKRRRWLRAAVSGGAATAGRAAKANAVAPSPSPAVRSDTTVAGPTMMGGAGGTGGVEITGSSEVERMLFRILVEYMAKEPPASPLVMEVLAEMGWFFFEEGFCVEAHSAFTAAAETAHIMDNWGILLKSGAGLLASSALTLDLSPIFNIIEPRLQLLHPSSPGTSEDPSSYTSATSYVGLGLAAGAMGVEDNEHICDGEIVLAMGTLLIYCLVDGGFGGCSGGSALSTWSRSCFHSLLRETVGESQSTGGVGATSAMQLGGVRPSGSIIATPSRSATVRGGGGGLVARGSVKQSASETGSPSTEAQKSTGRLGRAPSLSRGATSSGNNPGAVTGIPSRSPTATGVARAPTARKPSNPLGTQPVPRYTPAVPAPPAPNLASTKMLKLAVTSLCHAVMDDLGAAARTLSSALDGPLLRALQAESKRDHRHRIAALPLIALSLAAAVEVVVHRMIVPPRPPTGLDGSGAQGPGCGIRTVVGGAIGATAAASSLSALRLKAGDYRTFTRFFRKHYGLCEQLALSDGKGRGGSGGAAAGGSRTTTTSSPSCHLDAVAVLLDALATILESLTQTGFGSTGPAGWVVGDKGVRVVKELMRVLEAMDVVGGATGFSGLVGALGRGLTLIALPGGGDDSANLATALREKGINAFS
ncbi:hypothetical protein HDU96_007946 [Phlyctochytrium bullatum]|nr:hypothetical protein HDU96_007946 [Phlyctochytrium bullatum]